MDKLPIKIARFLDKHPLRKFRKGQTLLFQGEVPTSAYLIKKGVVKVYNITSSGDEQIIALNTEGDLLPESWVVGDAPVAYYFYEAFVDTEVYIIPRDELAKELQN